MMVSAFKARFVLLFLYHVHTFDGSYSQSTGPNDGCNPCQCLYVPKKNLDCSGKRITNITECLPGNSNCLFIPYIDFSNNLITQVVRRELSRRTTRSCFWDLSGNSISVFSVGATFSDCLYNTMDLSSNDFTNISEDSFHLDLYNFAGQRWLSSTFNFSRNRIRFVESLELDTSGSIVENLTIDLSFNEIVALHETVPLVIYTDVGYLGRVDVFLNDNNITEFGIEIRHRREEADVTFIDLSNNDIPRFTRDDLDRISDLGRDIRLDLSGNRWTCDCSQRFIADSSSFLRNILIKGESVDPICAEPPSVMGRHLLSLSEEEFVCSPELDPDAILVQEAIRGDTVTMICPFVDADPRPERVDWDLRLGSTCSDCPLVIDDVQAAAAGEYRCTVSNGESLTISQTLRFSGDIEASLPSATSSDHEQSGDMFCSSSHPIGLLASMAFLSVLWVLTTISLVVVSCMLYQLRRDTAQERRADVSVKYQHDLQEETQNYARYKGQGDQAYQDTEVTYEIPRADLIAPKPTGQEITYEVQDM